MNFKVSPFFALFLLIGFNLHSNTVLAGKITDEQKRLIRKGYECSQKEDYKCSIDIYESFLKQYEGQVDVSVKEGLMSILYGQYFSHINNLTDNRTNSYKDKEIVEGSLRAIDLIRESGKDDPGLNLTFHVWTTLILTENKDYKSAKDYLRRTKNLLKNFDRTGVNLQAWKWATTVCNRVDETIASARNSEAIAFLDRVFKSSSHLSSSSGGGSSVNNDSNAGSRNSSGSGTSTRTNTSNSVVSVQQDGTYNLGSYGNQAKYLVKCSNGYKTHIFYNPQNKCWKKTASYTCDYGSSPDELNKNAGYVCRNN